VSEAPIERQTEIVLEQMKLDPPARIFVCVPAWPPRCSGPELERDRGIRRQHPLPEPHPRGLDPVALGLRDEKALVRWRTRANHHDVQQKGRAEVLLDYHLRVGQVTRDTRLPAGSACEAPQYYPDVRRAQ
jgi:hypothetical protein